MIDPSVMVIQEEVAYEFDITHEMLLSRRRARPYSYPRMIAMFITRQLTDYSLPQIGQQFGGRHHTSVIHACEWALNNVEYKPVIKKIMARLR